MKKLLVVAALLCVASVASANMVMQVTEVTDADHVSRNVRAFDVTMSGTGAGADEFAAIDGKLTGDLVQCWASNGFISTVDTSSLGFTIFPSALAMKLDTHLLIGGTTVINAIAPEEDSNLPGGSVEGPFDAGWLRGLGTRISGAGNVNFAFAVPAANQGLVTPLLHVVVPADSNANLTAVAVAKSGDSVAIDHDFIPEPATMGLLAIGGIGALLRRRR